MSSRITVTFPDEIALKIETYAKEKSAPVTEIIRGAIIEYFNRKETENFQGQNAKDFGPDLAYMSSKLSDLWKYATNTREFTKKDHWIIIQLLLEILTEISAQKHGRDAANKMVAGMFEKMRG